MQASPAFQHQVTSEQFSAILERYSDNGYTNIHGGDIIIDLFHIEDEEERQEFADILAIPVDDIPADGLVTIHP
jgi:hypothetical protein